MGETKTGRNSLIKINDVAILQNRGWSMDRTGDTVEDSVIGKTARTYKPTMNSASGSIDLYYDPEDDAALIGTGVVVDIELYPDGEAEGDVEYSFSAITTGKSVSTTFDGMIEGSMSFQVSGPITEGTVPTP